MPKGQGDDPLGGKALSVVERGSKNRAQRFPRGARGDIHFGKDPIAPGAGADRLSPILPLSKDRFRQDVAHRFLKKHLSRAHATSRIRHSRYGM